LANVQHSALTGTDLHECKGAAAAASGQVPIASGSGTAPFGVLSYAQLSNTPFPKAQLNNVASTGQAIIKVYTTTAAAGLWSVTPSGFTTLWAVHATCLSGTTTLGSGTAIAQVASATTSTITGSNLVFSGTTIATSGTQTVQVTVIGV
jgi:hypothetical protein